jgi:hypothetical protein
MDRIQRERPLTRLSCDSREGQNVVTGWSRDGKVWKDFGSVEVPRGTKVRIGVVAEDCWGTATEIMFSEFRGPPLGN